MNPEKVVFGFFIVLSLTLNFGFFLGEIDNPEHHHVYELFAAIVVNVIATVLKFGDRTQMGAVLLSTSLVAVLQLFAASLVWALQCMPLTSDLPQRLPRALSRYPAGRCSPTWSLLYY